MSHIEYLVVQITKLDGASEVEELRVRSLCQAKLTLADRCVELVADGFTLVRAAPNGLFAHLDSPDGERTRLFIEEVRVTPLVLTDATNWTPAQMAEYLGIPLPE